MKCFSVYLRDDSLLDHMPKVRSISNAFAEKYPTFDQSHGMYLHIARTTTRPRLLKTHLPLHLLHETALSKAKVTNNETNNMLI